MVDDKLFSLEDIHLSSDFLNPNDFFEKYVFWRDIDIFYAILYFVY